MLPFPRWKGERTTRAAHAPRRVALRGLQETRVVGAPRRTRRRETATMGRRCSGLLRNARTPDLGDGGARRRSALQRDQRRRNRGRRRSAFSLAHEGRRSDGILPMELVSFYRHALPMRTARPESPHLLRSGKSDVDSARKSLNSREYTCGYFHRAIARIKNARDTGFHARATHATFDSASRRNMAAYPVLSPPAHPRINSGWCLASPS